MICIKGDHMQQCTVKWGVFKTGASSKAKDFLPRDWFEEYGRDGGIYISMEYPISYKPIL